MTASAAPPTAGSSNPPDQLPLDPNGLPTTHPFAPSVLAHPFEFDRVLRREAPVHRDATTGLFLVSSHEYVVEALKESS